MNKRYQVFVSSIYEDLQKERQEVIQALLELDCIPSGMELFPAADEDQWGLIKNIIDDCDYYLLIVAGRYGSTNAEGISYTEMEYRYALETGKPIISFLHEKPEDLSAKFSEKSAKGKKSLNAFRSLAQEKMCKFWNSPSDLGSKVSRSVVNLIKRSPAMGWVKADMVLSNEASEEILTLRKKVDDLEKALESVHTSAPAGTEELAQGDQTIELSFGYKAHWDPPSGYSRNKTSWRRKSWEMTWNQIIYVLSPRLIDESSDEEMRSALGMVFGKENVEELITNDIQKVKSVSGFEVEEEDFQTIKVQLKALGLMQKSVKNRSVKDVGTYWTLTPYGDTIMSRLRAVKKEELAS